MYKNLDELITKLKENKSVKFKVKVSANSSLNTIDFCEELVKIKVKAPAIEGKANKAVVEYISKLAGVSKSRVKIINGQKSAIKTIVIDL